MTLDELMIKYASPANESSLAKNIPIKLLPWFQGEFAGPSRKKVRYICSKSKLRRSYETRTIVSSRICSKIKRLGE